MVTFALEGKSKKSNRNWIRGTGDLEGLGTIATPVDYRFDTERSKLVGLLYGSNSANASRITPDDTLADRREPRPEPFSAIEELVAESSLQETIVPDPQGQVPVAAMATTYDCDVDLVSDTEIVCWVQLTNDVLVKSAFPRTALREGMVREGSELVWDLRTDTLRKRTFDNNDLLDKLQELNRQADPA